MGGLAEKCRKFFEQLLPAEINVGSVLPGKQVEKALASIERSVSKRLWSNHHNHAFISA